MKKHYVIIGAIMLALGVTLGDLSFMTNLSVGLIALGMVNLGKGLLK